MKKIKVSLLNKLEAKECSVENYSNDFELKKELLRLLNYQISDLNSTFLFINNGNDEIYSSHAKYPLTPLTKFYLISPEVLTGIKETLGEYNKSDNNLSIEDDFQELISPIKDKTLFEAYLKLNDIDLFSSMKSLIKEAKIHILRILGPLNNKNILKLLKIQEEFDKNITLLMNNYLAKKQFHDNNLIIKTKNLFESKNIQYSEDYISSIYQETIHTILDYIEKMKNITNENQRNEIISQWNTYMTKDSIVEKHIMGNIKLLTEKVCSFLHIKEIIESDSNSNRSEHFRISYSIEDPSKSYFSEEIQFQERILSSKSYEKDQSIISQEISSINEIDGNKNFDEPIKSNNLIMVSEDIVQPVKIEDNSNRQFIYQRNEFSNNPQFSFNREQSIGTQILHIRSDDSKNKKAKSINESMENEYIMSAKYFENMTLIRNLQENLNQTQNDLDDTKNELRKIQKLLIKVQNEKIEIQIEYNKVQKEKDEIQKHLEIIKKEALKQNNQFKIEFEKLTGFHSKEASEKNEYIHRLKESFQNLEISKTENNELLKQMKQFNSEISLLSSENIVFKISMDQFSERLLKHFNETKDIFDEYEYSTDPLISLDIFCKTHIKNLKQMKEYILEFEKYQKLSREIIKFNLNKPIKKGDHMLFLKYTNQNFLLAITNFNKENLFYVAKFEPTIKIKDSIVYHAVIVKDPIPLDQNKFDFLNLSLFNAFYIEIEILEGSNLQNIPRGKISLNSSKFSYLEENIDVKNNNNEDQILHFKDNYNKIKVTSSSPNKDLMDIDIKNGKKKNNKIQLISNYDVENNIH